MTLFVKTNILRECVLILVPLNYYIDNNSKDDAELLIGESTCEVVQDLKPFDRSEFFSNVWNYFVRCCDCMVLKFPFKGNVLHHGKACNIEKIETASFSSIFFFF